jgi:hypothetical protein
MTADVPPVAHVGSQKIGRPAYLVRWQVALVGGLVAGTIALLRWKYAAWMPSDLDHLWHAARAVLAGANPYDAVGPGRAFDWDWGVFYPLPAILLVMPFTVLPVEAARFAFGVLAGTTLGFAMGTRWRTLWPLFLSQAFFLAVSRNQWSTFILAAVWMPALGFVIAAKPNIGLIALAAQRRETVVRVVLLVGVLSVLAFVVRPSWLGEWLTLARAAPNKEIALLQPAGFLLLAAIVFWRTMEGRLLLAAAIAPQTPSAYDALLLFPLCQTRLQTALLALLTHLAQFAVLQLGPYANHDAFYDSLAKIIVLLVMMPALAIALRNHAANRQHSVAPSVPEADSKRTSVFASPMEAVLLFLLFLAFLLQWWIIYGQW